MTNNYEFWIQIAVILIGLGGSYVSIQKKLSVLETEIQWIKESLFGKNDHPKRK